MFVEHLHKEAGGWPDTLALESEDLVLRASSELCCMHTWAEPLTLRASVYACLTTIVAVHRYGFHNETAVYILHSDRTWLLLSPCSEFALASVTRDLLIAKADKCLLVFILEELVTHCH